MAKHEYPRMPDGSALVSVKAADGNFDVYVGNQFVIRAPQADASVTYIANAITKGLLDAWPVLGDVKLDEKPWQRKTLKLVLAHDPVPGNRHPNGGPFWYCICGEAIVSLAGVWWHIRRDGPLHANEPASKEEVGAFVRGVADKMREAANAD